MRSLVAQLVALALAVPFSTGTSSHATSHIPAQKLDIPVLQHQRDRRSRPVCGSYCRAQRLRRELHIVHRRALAVARRAALPTPPSPHLGWQRTKLRTQLAVQVRVLGRYRAEARRPLRARLARFEAWVCIHRHEAAWNDAGDPYWGGLQMDRTFMLTYGRDMIRLHHGGLANTWTPAEQIIVAERAYQARGYEPWPETSRACGLS